MHLRQQHYFTIENPGVYKVYPADGLQSPASPFMKIVEVDSSESELEYRHPVITGENRYTKVVCSPDDLIAYLRMRTKWAYLIVPWILFVVLLSAELLLTWRCRKETMQKNELFDRSDSGTYAS